MTWCPNSSSVSIRTGGNRPSSIRSGKSVRAVTRWSEPTPTSSSSARRKTWRSDCDKSISSSWKIRTLTFGIFHSRTLLDSAPIYRRLLTWIYEGRLLNLGPVDQPWPVNTHFVRGSITVQLISCLFFWNQLLYLCWNCNIFTCFVEYKPVKQVSRTVILPLAKYVSIFLASFLRIISY